MHLDAKLSLQHPKNKENSFGHRKLKFCAYPMLLVTNNTKMVCCSKTTNSKKISSPAGNRTPVSRVTGGDTYHYTTEDTSASSRDWIKYIWVNWGELRTFKKKNDQSLTRMTNVIIFFPNDKGVWLRNNNFHRFKLDVHFGLDTKTSSYSKSTECLKWRAVASVV